jgi:ribonuclease R
MQRRLPSKADLLRLLEEAGRPLHARELASRLQVSEGKYRDVLEVLDRLAADGVVKRLGGSRFRAAGNRAETESWEGILTIHPRGFGFVNSAGREDVYISPDSIRGALHGDRVTVSVVARSARGVEGRVEDVLERKVTRVAGVLVKRGRSAWLEPDDPRVRGPIVLGDVSEGRNGDAAVVELTRYPENADENAEGRLLEVLGLPGVAQTEMKKVLLRESIVEQHPVEALEEAEQAVKRVFSSGLEARRDLRHVPLPTIDPQDARDHDDAVWVERNGAGYRAYIAIADVSEFVREGSALDQEALRRGCSVYLPDRAIPMLPPQLSADACSLVPDQDRPCLCVIADLRRDGTLKSVELVEGLMRSAAGLTYDQVARTLGFTEKGPKSRAAEAMREDLAVLDELARKLRRQRMQRGALDLELPEARVVLDDEGVPTDIVRRAQDPGLSRAYQMIEELMLLANEAVAVWLSEREVPTVYRVHAPPDEAKLERLAGVCETAGVPFSIEEVLEPGGVGRWLATVAEHPSREVLNMLLLRSLKQATYDVDNVGHFGLASPAYLHFTSPIRRYPDLVVHRSVKAVLRGQRVAKGTNAVEKLRTFATQASTRERQAADVEREVVDLYRALVMKDRIGEVLEGRVSGVVGSGVFLALDEPFVDVLVKLEELGRDDYELDDNELAVVGRRSGDRVSLGDRMTIEVIDVSVLRRTVYGRRLVSTAANEQRPAAAKVDARPLKGRHGPGRREEIRAARRNKDEVRAFESGEGTRAQRREAAKGGAERGAQGGPQRGGQGSAQKPSRGGHAEEAPRAARPGAKAAPKKGAPSAGRSPRAGTPARAGASETKRVGAGGVGRSTRATGRAKLSASTRLRTPKKTTRR